MSKTEEQESNCSKHLEPLSLVGLFGFEKPF